MVMCVETMLARCGITCPLKKLIPSFRSVSAQKAQELLNEGYTYLDVRTPEEFAAGHVEGAVNIAFKLDGKKNPAFGDEVLAKFDKDAKLVVACQGGVRSADARARLLALGFTNVQDMGCGFAGWTKSGFPTTN